MARFPDFLPHLRHPDTRAEGRAVLGLAAPVVMVQVGMMLMGTVDTMMLGRDSELALAAGALGHTISFGFLVLPMGMLMVLDPLVGQAVGADDWRGVATHFKRGLVLTSVVLIPLLLLHVFPEGLLRLAGQQPEVAALTVSYTQALAPGVVAFMFFIVFRQTLQAMSIVRPAVVAIVVANVVNVFANYALIFGRLGMPRLGVAGSGLATSISRWVLLLTLMGLVWPTLRRIWPARRFRTLRLRGFRQALALGIPIGIQTSLEMWLFTAVALTMGHLGARALAAHQIALNISALSFMVPLGIAGAAATRVGNAVGRGDMPAARRSAAISLFLGGGVMTLFALVYGLFPTLLARLYTSENAVALLAATLLPIAALFQVFDGLQVVGAGVLRGSGDTRIPAIIALVGYWVLAFPLAYMVAFRFGHGPRGLWWGLTVGLSTVAVMLLLRIRRLFRGDIKALVVQDD